MTKINSKNKGSSFERKIANQLSERFAKHLGIEKGFRRNSDSGSYFGGANMSRVVQHDMDRAIFGDLICPINFLYTIECKHYKSAPSFQSLINKDVSQWDTWIKQAEQDSTNANKLCLLIIKYNGVNELVFIKNTIDKDCIFKYKEYIVYKLSDFLSLDDRLFFSEF
jgi:hypothetical protein